MELSVVQPGRARCFGAPGTALGGWLLGANQHFVCLAAVPLSMLLFSVMLLHNNTKYPGTIYFGGSAYQSYAHSMFLVMAELLRDERRGCWFLRRDFGSSLAHDCPK